MVVIVQRISTTYWLSSAIQPFAPSNSITTFETVVAFVRADRVHGNYHEMIWVSDKAFRLLFQKYQCNKDRKEVLIDLIFNIIHARLIRLSQNDR